MKGFTLENTKKMYEKNPNFTTKFVEVKYNHSSLIIPPSSCDNCEYSHIIYGTNFTELNGDYVNFRYCDQWDFIYPQIDAPYLVCEWMIEDNKDSPTDEQEAQRTYLPTPNITFPLKEDKAQELMEMLFDSTTLKLSHVDGSYFNFEINGIDVGGIKADYPEDMNDPFCILKMARSIAELTIGDWSTETSEGNDIYLFTNLNFDPEHDPQRMEFKSWLKLGKENK